MTRVSQPVRPGRQTKIPGNSKIVERELIVYKITTWISTLVVLLLVVILGYQGFLKDKELFFFSDRTVSVQSPQDEAIREIMAPLQYSGLRALERDEVTLSLNFQRRTWTLRNIHVFDPQGRVVLDEGKYGTCGQLAAYMYDRIKPLLGENYRITFLRAMQSGFFPTEKGAHYVLGISPKTARLGFSPQRYILDPSFQRYGAMSDFEDYIFLEDFSVLPFVEDHQSDLTQPVSGSVPIYIKDAYLIGFTVEDNNGLFDRDNFVVAVTMTKKHHYAGRYLFALRKNRGETEELENREMGRGFMKDSRYQSLKAKIIKLFDTATVQ